MGVILDVPYQDVKAVGAKWDAVADELDGNWRRLHKASTAGFSTDVAAAVEAFRETWVDEIKASATSAQTHADTVSTYLASLFDLDLATAKAVRAVLPWAQRNAGIEQV